MKVEIKFEDRIYSWEIKIADKESMDIKIDEKFILVFKGKIKLANIYEQIPGLNGYSAEEILSNLSDLKSEKFNIYKDKESYNLDIAIKVLKKEKHFITSLEKITKATESDMLKTLKRKIEENDNKLKFLEGEMKRLKILCEEEKIEKEKNEEKKKLILIFLNLLLQKK